MNFSIQEFYNHNGFFQMFSFLFIWMHIHVMFNFKQRHTRLVALCREKMYVDYEFMFMTKKELILFWTYVVFVGFGIANITQMEWFCYLGIIIFDWVLRPKLYRKPFKQHIHLIGGQILSILVITLFVIILLI